MGAAGPVRGEPCGSVPLSGMCSPSQPVGCLECVWGPWDPMALPPMGSDETSSGHGDPSTQSSEQWSTRSLGAGPAPGTRGFLVLCATHIRACSFILWRWGRRWGLRLRTVWGPAPLCRPAGPAAEAWATLLGKRDCSDLGGCPGVSEDGDTQGQLRTEGKGLIVIGGV